VQTGGQTYYDTVIKFFNPVQLLYDDMEGANASGSWVVSANWNYSTGIAFGGLKSLTESPSGLYGANRNDNIRYNGTFDLSNATAAYLTFWVRHRAENFRDKLQVQFSPDGTTWTAIAGRTTVQEPGTLDGSTIDGQPALTGVKEDWIPEMYDLSAFLGQPAVRLRLVFTSDANTTGYDFQVDEGFSIDDLKLIKSTTALVILPVKFISLTGQQKPNNTIVLNWDAVTDANHDHFVIERSADGTSFSAIGTNTGQPYIFIDDSPFTGFNYYRIRAVDRDGHFAYSKTIHLVYKPAWDITLYPNPVLDELHIRLKTFGSENISLTVSDINGKIVYTREYSAGVSNNDITVDAHAWPSGVYVLKMINSRKETLVVRQLVRQ
jgi:carboxypeptidase T